MSNDRNIPVEYVPPSVYFSELNKFRVAGKYCDIKIVIDGITFPCHRNILASASTFFKAMLGGQYDESERKEITMDSVSAACFELVLNFIYCQPLDISPCNSFELLSAARFFHLETMENYCVGYVIQNIPEKHVFEVCTFAALANKQHLYTTVLAYIAKNFATVCNQKAFLEISYEVLMGIVNHIRLKCTQDIILDSIIRWADGKKVSFSQMSGLLSYVDTGDYMAKLICKNAIQKLSVSDEDSTTKDDHLISDTEAAVDSLYKNVVRYIAHNISKLYSSVMFSQLSYDLIEAVIEHPNLNGLTDDLINLINRWTKNQNASKDQVQKLFSYVLRRSQQYKQISNHLTEAACSDDSRLYVHAITYPNHDIVELTYDESTQKWKKNERYSNKAYYQRSVLMNGRLFTLSLKDNGSNDPLSYNYQFQAKKNDAELKYLATPEIRCTDRFNMAVFENTIYLQTLIDCPPITIDMRLMYFPNSYENSSSSLFAYNYHLNEWFLVKEVHDAESKDLHLVFLEDQLYLVGTINTYPTGTVATAFVYNKESRRWNSSPRPLCIRINGAACAHNGKIYFFGGESNALEAYDPRERRWEMLKSAEYNRSFHRLVSYRNKLWAIGGNNDLPIECYNPITNVWTSTNSLQEVLDRNARIADAFVL